MTDSKAVCDRPPSSDILSCCRHPLLSELRVLLVHGLLHLAGFDHEQGEQQLQQMAQHETAILDELGWEGSGLISVAEAAASEDSSQGEEDAYSHEPASSRSSFSASSTNSTSSSGSDVSTRSISTVFSTVRYSPHY